MVREDILRVWQAANRYAAMAARYDRSGATLLASMWRKQARINRDYVSQALRK